MPPQIIDPTAPVDTELVEEETKHQEEENKEQLNSDLRVDAYNNEFENNGASVQELNGHESADGGENSSSEDDDDDLAMEDENEESQLTLPMNTSLINQRPSERVNSNGT